MESWYSHDAVWFEERGSQQQWWVMLIIFPHSVLSFSRLSGLVRIFCNVFDVFDFKAFIWFEKLNLKENINITVKIEILWNIDMILQKSS